MGKKYGIKWMVPVLAMAMGVSVSACGGESGPDMDTAQGVAMSAASAMNEVRSMSETLISDVSGNISLTEFGTSEKITSHSVQDMERTFDPYVTHQKYTSEMSGTGEQESFEIDRYYEQDGDRLTVYQTTDGGDSWTKSSTDMPDEYDPVSGIIKKIAKGSLDADLEEDTREVDGEECLVLDTEVPGDVIADLQGSIISDEKDKEELGEESADMVLYISRESLLPRKMTGDLEEIGDILVGSTLPDSEEQKAEVDISRYDIEYTFGDFNEIDDISIPDEAKDAETVPDTSASSTAVPSSTPTPSSVSSSSAAPTSTPAATQNPEANDSTGNADWSTLAFSLDGKDYQVPFAYSDLQSDWSFSLSDLGYENGYVTNPGDKKQCTIEVKNDHYDMKFYIGTANTSNSVQDITENSVWAVSMDISLAKTWPEMKLAGGITWGSTYDQIVAAYGEPDEEPYRSEELGYYVLTYYKDYRQQMKVCIYDDGGLKRVDLKDYGI
ncbi:MAG: DUF6612 family protein [Bilifractor sp.]